MTPLPPARRLSWPVVFMAACLLFHPAPAAAQEPAPKPAAQQPPSGEQQTGQQQTDDKSKGEKPAKRDKDAPVTVRGCLRGSMLDRVEAEETILNLTSSLRLLSKGEIKKTLKASNGRQIEVSGILRLPPRNPLSGKIGGTTVSVGVGDPRSPQTQLQNQMSQQTYGTLDVLAVKGIGPCEGASTTR